MWPFRKKKKQRVLTQKQRAETRSTLLALGPEIAMTRCTHIYRFSEADAETAIMAIWDTIPAGELKYWNLDRP